MSYISQRFNGNIAQFTLHSVYSEVIGLRENGAIIQLPSEVHLQPCDTVAKGPLPYTYFGDFEIFTISTSEYCGHL